MAGSVVSWPAGSSVKTWYPRLPCRGVRRHAARQVVGEPARRVEGRVGEGGEPAHGRPDVGRVVHVHQTAGRDAVVDAGGGDAEQITQDGERVAGAEVRDEVHRLRGDVGEVAAGDGEHAVAARAHLLSAEQGGEGRAQRVVRWPVRGGERPLFGRGGFESRASPVPAGWGQRGVLGEAEVGEHPAGEVGVGHHPDRAARRGADADQRARGAHAGPGGVGCVEGSGGGCERIEGHRRDLARMTDDELRALVRFMKSATTSTETAIRDLA